MEDHEDDRKKELPSNGRLCIKLKIHKSEEADHQDHQLSPGEESLLSLIGEGGVKDQHQNTNTNTAPGSEEKNKEVVEAGGGGGKEVRRVCGFCNKGFSSGKALGGHMRVHVQATHGKASGSGGGGVGALQMKPQRHVNNGSSSSNNVAAAGGMINMVPVCSLCGKTFSSMKSLFGHMRCHPERDWRGIQPPPTPTPPHPPTKNSSSSTLSDACARRNIDFGEQIDSTNTTNAVAAAAVVDAEAMPLHPNPNPKPNPNRRVEVDLARRFRGWSRTDKRGRKIGGTSTGTSGSSDPSESTGGATAVSASSWSGAAGSGSGSEEQIPDAVYNLMLLAQGRPFSSYQHQQYDSMACRNVGYNNSKYDNNNNKRRSPMEEDEEHQQLMKSNPQDDGGGNDDNEDLLEVKGGNKGKSQVLLGTPDRNCLEQQHEHHGRRGSKMMKHSKLKQEGEEEEEDRSWRSEEEDDGRHGGHKKKTVVTMMKNKAKSEDQASLMTLKKKKQKKKMKLRDLDTVVDDVGEPVDEKEKYKCSTCNKSFSTHQALGGHRSSHNKLKHQHHRPQLPPPQQVTTTGEQVAAAAMEVEATGSVGGVGKVLLGFDLNELPEEGSGMELDEYWGGGA